MNVGKREEILPYQSIGLSKRDYVATIGIEKVPKNREGIAQLANDISLVCSEIRSEDILVVVLNEATDNAFFMGEDLISRLLTDEKDLEVECLSVGEALTQLEQPVIAAIEGDALGLGLELILTCDVRICTEKSHFGFTQVKTGMIPCDGGTQRLPRIVGKAKAVEILLTGDMIDAQEALRIGLVNSIVEPDELSETVVEMAHEVASKGPIALRYAKEAINKGMDLTFEQGLRLEADLYLLLHTTRDRTEGIRAFEEKRKPHFEGR